MQTQERISNKSQLLNLSKFLFPLTTDNALIELIFLDITVFIVNHCLVQPCRVVQTLCWLSQSSLPDCALLNWLLTSFQNGLFLFLCLESYLQSLNCELSFFRYRHVGSRWSEAFSQLIRIIWSHGHTHPRELHPDPSFIVIVRWWFLIQFKLLLYSFGIQVLQVRQVFELWLSTCSLINVSSNLVNQLFSLGLFVRLDILFVITLVQSKCLFLTLKWNFLKERLDFVVIMLTEVVFVTFYFYIQLLDSYWLLFGWLCGLFDLLIFSLWGLASNINFNLGHFLDMFSFLYLVVHFFQLFLVLLFLIIGAGFLMNLHLGLHLVFLCILILAFTKLKIFQLSHNSDVLKFSCISNNLWMPELWSVIRFKISKLLQESWYLSDYSK